jgi:hypothetical protein
MTQAIDSQLQDARWRIACIEIDPTYDSEYEFVFPCEREEFLRVRFTGIGLHQHRPGNSIAL